MLFIRTAQPYIFFSHTLLVFYVTMYVCYIQSFLSASPDNLYIYNLYILLIYCSGCYSWDRQKGEK
jgi:hypothetical protein